MGYFAKPEVLLFCCLGLNMHAVAARAFSCLAAALILPLATGAKASERWIHLATPHFEMYTTSGEKQGTAALQIFEQIRYFFIQSSIASKAPDAQVRIIAFNSEKQYRPYQLSEGAFAYYLRSRKVDYIVMQDIGPDHYPAAMHEYTHLVIEHLGLKLPIWLNEGLADLYSSLEPRGGKALIGRPISGRSQVLFQQRWIPLSVLFSVGRDSRYYHEGDKVSIFYAESWALTHMLVLSDDYRHAFTKFLAAVAQGRPVAACFQSIYGKNLDEVMQDLAQYVHRSTVSAVLYPVKLSKQDLEPEVSTAPDFDVQLALADLLASQKRTMPEAAERLARLAASNRESAVVEESLGYLRWQQGDLTGAREHFGLAEQRGSQDAEMLFQYSQLLRMAKAPSDQISTALRRAVKNKPDFREAWFNLGMTEMEAQHWGTARSAFLQIRTVMPEHAYSYFTALAWCAQQLGELTEARAAELGAKQYARDPDQILQTSNMLLHLDGLEKPRERPAATAVTSLATPSPAQQATEQPGLPRDVSSIRAPHMQHVEGLVQSMECRFRHPRLRVLVGSLEMMLDLGNWDDVKVRNGRSGHLDLTCGSLQPPRSMSIFYVPTETTGVAGVIRELVY